MGNDNYQSLMESGKKKGKDLLQLSQYKKAITNFVNIVSGENIPVKFHSHDESYTDGQEIVIGANLSDKNFDPVVGLALHEASHIKLTCFTALMGLPTDVEVRLKYYREKTNQDLGAQITYVKDLVNYIEDRRIDYFIYKTSPGYKGYYHSLYNKYFQDSTVTKALGTEYYTSETFECYAFRFFNLVNKNRNLSALNGLKEIWETLDIANISRLTHTEDSIELALDIYRIIANNVIDSNKSGETKPNGKSNKKAKSKTELSNDPGSKPNELSDAQIDRLPKLLEKQREFLRGQIKKTKLTKKESKKMKALESAGVTEKQVGVKGAGRDFITDGDKVVNVPVILIKNLTKQLIDSHVYPEIMSSYRDERQRDAIHEAFAAGRVLSKKLKVVNEENETKHSRLSKGKIDKRLVHQFGFGGENNFYKTVTDKYNKSICHISIDASGSMWGENFYNSIKMAVTTAVAAKLSKKIDIVISFRTTHEVGSNDSRPLILLAYDSRKDSLVKIKELFPYLNCGGLTPEGLCFDAIKEEIIMKSDKSYNKYFINLSDGLPNSGCKDVYYAGTVAYAHTAKVIKGFKDSGVGVLSYYVGDDNYTAGRDAFRQMYGKNAQFIKVTEINKIAKTLNYMFLLNSNKTTIVC